MKVGLAIGKLGFGGAESQLIRLAQGLVLRGHQVNVLCYDGASGRDQELRSSKVQVVAGQGGSRRDKIRQYRKWLQDFDPDLVHAFMKRASMLAILGRKFGKKFPVIASDLSTATYNRSSPSLWMALAVFSMADVVATQTKLNERSLQLLGPWLRGKTKVIRNGLDTTSFIPLAGLPDRDPFRFAVVGSVYKVKNPIVVVKAVSLLVSQGMNNFVVDWYGRKGLKGDAHPSEDFQLAMELIAKYRIQDRIVFHGETNPILLAYHRSHCLLHASIQEGFPNAVVEGMACGLPLVVSRVSDLPMVIQTAQNGFLFDERRPESIADAMQKMLDLGEQERSQMGQRSRQLAVEWFGMDRFVSEYESLYHQLIGRRK